jgi:hypothetical protein
MSAHTEEIPGVAVTELSPTERTLVWAFRTMAAAPACDARLRFGLGSILPPEQTDGAAHLLRRTFRSIELQSLRTIIIGVTPSRGVTWDEAALLALFAAARTDQGAARLWARRLGVSDLDPTTLADLRATATMFAQRGAVSPPHIPGVTSPRLPAHEPELLARSLGVHNDRSQT